MPGECRRVGRVASATGGGRYAGRQEVGKSHAGRQGDMLVGTRYAYRQEVTYRIEKWDGQTTDGPVGELGTGRRGPGILSELWANVILRASIAAWALAQVIKFVLVLCTKRRVDMARLVASGGMPSSHTAFVSALAMGTGRVVGFATPLFAVAVVFASIVVHDATGVRRAVGEQAEVLNRIIDDLYRGSGIRPERLRELLGHTAVEALAGAALGIVTAAFLT